jgi:hypothetical protein
VVDNDRGGILNSEEILQLPAQEVADRLALVNVAVEKAKAGFIISKSKENSSKAPVR